MPSARLTLTLGLFALLTVGCRDAEGSEDSSESEDDGMTSRDCSGATETLDAHLVVNSAEDLDALEGINHITGELQIDRTDFTDLSAFACIEEVDQELTIFGNDALTDVSGLESLNRVGGSFIISENPALTELTGIDELTQVEGSLVIQDNTMMTGISGLTSLETIREAFNIRSNDALTHIDGMQALRTVGGQLAITQNPSLCISSVNRVGAGITDPAVIPDNWSTRSNDDNC